jgi:uncharacterized protein YpbB
MLKFLKSAKIALVNGVVKKMNLYDFLIIEVLLKVNGSRKITGIYYILSGKKTSQSLSDSQWLGLENYYASFHGMSIEEFYTLINELLDRELLIEIEKNTFVPTNKGVLFFKENRKNGQFMEKLNGLKFSSIEQKSWQVISLYAQAISNLVYNNHSYPPVVREREITDLVRGLIPKTRKEIEKKAVRLFEELFTIMKDSDTVSSEVFVKKLSGHHRIGSTFDQIANELQISRAEAVLRFRGVLHQILSKCADSPPLYPGFYELLGNFIDIPPLTQSALKTFQLLKRGKTMKDIIRIRSIKPSTFEDHLVEIARAVPQFSIQPYVNKEDFEKVVQFYKNTSEIKLRPIKDAFPHLTYLQIRLVLAKEGGKNETGNSA